MSDNLPPLPDEGLLDGEIRVWTTSQMRAYARAAIEADRVSRDVPAGWRDLLISLTEHAAEAGDHTEESFRRGVVHLANRAHKFLAAPQPQPVQEPGACAMCGALQDDQVITQPEQALPSEIIGYVPIGAIEDVPLDGHIPVFAQPKPANKQKD